MTPYRSGPGPSEGHVVDLRTACPACATLVAHASSAIEPACPKCGADVDVDRWQQPGDAPAPRVISHTRGSHDALASLGRRLGVEGPPQSLQVEVRGMHVALVCSSDEDGPTALKLRIPTPGLPLMDLAREGFDEAREKASGLSHEVEIGDESFDAVVYVASASVDEDARTTLRPEAVRRAVLRLLLAAPSVNCDAAGVSISIPASEGSFDPDTVLAALDDLRVIAGAPRPLRTTRSTASRRARVSVTAFATLLAFGFVAGAVGCSDHETFDAMKAWGFGAALGVPLVFYVRALFTNLLEGSARALRGVRIATWVSALVVPVVSGMLFIGCNGWFDRGAETEVLVAVTRVDPPDDESHGSITVRMPDGHSASFPLRTELGKLKVGDVARMWSRPGAFGFPWATRPLVAGPPP